MKPAILASAIVAAISISGCAATHNIVTAAAASAANAEDIALIDIEYGLCNAISVGAWVRRYGQDQEKAAAWRTLCSKASNQTPRQEQQTGEQKIR